MKQFYLSVLLFPVVSIALAQNVGVGTPLPGSKLSVKGNLSIGTNYSILTTNLPADGLIIEGNTGIGISNPGTKLDVSGDVRTTGYFRITSGTGKGIRFWDSDTYKISMGNTAEYQYGPITDYSIKFSMNNAANRGWTWGSTGSTPIAALTATGNMQLAGNLGLGLTPAYKLDVSGDVRISGLSGTGNALVIASSAGLLSRTAFSGNATDVLTGTGTFASISSLTGDYWTQTGSNLYPNQTTWNVGIGNSAPGTKLDIGSTTDTSSQVVRVTSSKNYAGLQLRGDQGNVSGEPGGAYITLATDAEAVKGIIGMVNIADQDGAGGTFSKTLGNSMVVGSKTGPMHLGASGSVDFTIASNGTVGIGTTAPSGAALVIRDTATANAGYFGIDNRVHITDAALTTNRTQYGIYNYINNIGTQSVDVDLDRQYQYASYNYWHQNDANATIRQGFGAHNYAFNQAGTTFNALYGAYNYGRNRGTVPSMYGSMNYALQDLAGANTTTSYGAFNQSQVTADTIANAYGSYNYSLASSNGVYTGAWGSYSRIRTQDNGIITNAYGVDALIERAGSSTITTGYLFKGNYSGTIGTKWGLYLTGETKNYLSGILGIGTSDPQSTLHVNGRVETSRLGTVGTYNSSEVQGIWSIGRAYNVDVTANDFGNQYGMVYAHTNAGTSTSKLPISGWGHQILFTSNGTRNAAISLSSGHGYFAGNVGIGNTAPAEKLDVVGNIKLSGGIHDGTSLGSANQVLMSTGSDVYWSSVSPSGHVKILDVALTNASNYNLTGLDGNTDKNYIIILHGQFNTGGSSRVIRIRPNSDATLANYSYFINSFWQYYGGYGWDYYAFDTDGIGLIEMVGDDQYIFCQTALRASTGSYRNASSTLSYQSGTAKNSGVEVSEGAWKNTTTNITSLYFYFGGGTFTGRLVVYALQ